MKKSANTSIYNLYSQENNQNFLSIGNHFLRLKGDFMTLCSQITFLFQEKLPIIYANIRV
jgi:hypothetical protein